MKMKFVSKEDLNRIVDALSSNFLDLSNMEKELKEKGITISAGEHD